MKTLREITAGGIGGMALGVVLRITVVFFAAPDPTTVAHTTTPPRKVEQPPSDSPLTVEIHQAAYAPSTEARNAVESGAVRFVIRPGPNSDNSDVARILLRLGALPVSQNGEMLFIWNSGEGQWEQIRSPETLSGYAISRAWELPHREAVEEQAAKLPASALVFLALPNNQEMRLVGAVEHALQPHPLADYGRVELTLANTSGGHIQWTLQRAVRRDDSEIVPNIILAI
jgi:hypothetical protein